MPVLDKIIEIEYWPRVVITLAATPPALQRCTWIGFAAL
jgi:hypothetical protein